MIVWQSYEVWLRATVLVGACNAPVTGKPQNSWVADEVIKRQGGKPNGYLSKQITTPSPSVRLRVVAATLLGSSGVKDPRSRRQKIENYKRAAKNSMEPCETLSQGSCILLGLSSITRYKVYTFKRLTAL